MGRDVLLMVKASVAAERLRWTRSTLFSCWPIDQRPTDFEHASGARPTLPAPRHAPLSCGLCHSSGNLRDSSAVPQELCRGLQVERRAGVGGEPSPGTMSPALCKKTRGAHRPWLPQGVAGTLGGCNGRPLAWSGAGAPEAGNSSPNPG